MATSNTTTFNQNRDEIIYSALNLLNEYGTDNNPEPNDIAIANTFLNMLVKHWQGKQLHLWKRKEGVLFFNVGQEKYDLSSDGDHAADADDYVRTTVNTTVSSGTSLVVSSSTGMSVSDNIGICLDNNNTFWTTITAISGTTITLHDSITSQATSGNSVYAYTVILGQILDVMAARRRDVTLKDIPLNKISHSEYQLMNDKFTAGTPVSWYFDRQRDAGFMYIWKSPNLVTDVFHFTYRKKIEDFTSSVDDPDFPDEWLLTLAYNLAVLLAPMFGKDDKLQSLVPMAQTFLDEVSGWDNEFTNAQVVIVKGGRR